MKMIDIALRITKGTTPNSSSFGRNEVTYIKSESLNYNGIIDESKFTTIDTETHNTKLKRSILKENDILYSIAGMNLGKVGIVEKKYLPANTNQAVALITVNEEFIIPKYLYYYLQQDSIVNSVNLGVSQSAQPNINLAQIGNFDINLPSKQMQKKIVKILDNITNKIKINVDINKNLHYLINQNYSKYLSELQDFVELDIKEIFDFETGVEPGSKNYLDKKSADTVKFYRVGDMNSDCKTFIKKDLANGKYLNENDLVVSFDATIGRIGYGLLGSYSTGMKKISIKEQYKHVIDNSIVYAYFNNRDVQNIMMENSRGTTILHASSSIDFMKFKYNEILLKKYGQLISALFEKMKNIKKENEKLYQLRGTLLPKLINGEIDLENIEI